MFEGASVWSAKEGAVAGCKHVASKTARKQTVVRQRLGKRRHSITKGTLDNSDMQVLVAKPEACTVRLQSFENAVCASRQSKYATVRLRS